MANVDRVLIDDWYVVARIEDCPPNSIKSVRLLGEDLVLWRGSTSESPILAWQDRCPHRGTRLSLGKIVDDTFTCKYHGWAYNSAGQCVNIPSSGAQRPPTGICIKTYQCQECWGLVWVSLGNPAHDVPPFPEWNDPNYRKIYFGTHSHHFYASPFRVFESIFDTSHFSFVHQGSLGTDTQPEVGEQIVEVKSDSITISNIEINQSSIGSTGIDSRVTYTYKIYPPLTLYGYKESIKGKMTFLNTVTPIDEEESLVWGQLAMDYGHEIPKLEIAQFYDEVMSQDIPVVGSQRPKLLPLLSQNDSNTPWTSEVHAPCDQASVAYRRCLKKLGITYGVC